MIFIPKENIALILTELDRLERNKQLILAEIRKRQHEGIEAKEARGEWDDYGRPRILEIDKSSKEYNENFK